MEEKVLFKSKRKACVLPVVIMLVCLVVIGLLAGNSIIKNRQWRADEVDFDVMAKAHDTAVHVSIPLGIVAVGSMLLYLSRIGYRFEITDKEIRARGKFGKKLWGDGRLPLTFIGDIQVAKNDVYIVSVGGVPYEVKGVRNIDELQKVVEEQLSGIFIQNRKEHEERRKNNQPSQADLQRMINNYQAQISYNASKQAKKQRAKSIVKGAAVGGIIGGDVGAVVGAVIAKDRLDNKDK